ncbi:hypothetical protein [Streptomyces sp. NPDC056632]|uniref:hypothetical protein n=1 Tax=Streptomyces sp. NPDC056632 TaxID=3345884 RepID=UPI0036CEEC47
MLGLKRSTPRFATLTAGAALVAAAASPALGSPAAAAPETAAATPLRVLFDNSKAETAGNADWMIGPGQPDPLTQNPTPSVETHRTGALSARGVALIDDTSLTVG